MSTATAIAKCVGKVLHMGYKKATIYLSEQYVVKATAHKYAHNQSTAVVTLGRPNYAERKFIRKMVEAGRKFPLKEIQLKGWLVKRG